jgi:hypothetical protein
VTFIPYMDVLRFVRSQMKSQELASEMTTQKSEAALPKAGLRGVAD